MRRAALRTAVAARPNRYRQAQRLVRHVVKVINNLWRRSALERRAERVLRPLCLGRRSWLFAGSDRGGLRAAAMYTLIGTAKLNNVDPQAWLVDVLGRIAATPQSRLHELLPWKWQEHRRHDQAA